jgi:hypothetical protein
MGCYGTMPSNDLFYFTDNRKKEKAIGGFEIGTWLLTIR